MESEKDILKDRNEYDNLSKEIAFKHDEIKCLQEKKHFLLSKYYKYRIWKHCEWESSNQLKVIRLLNSKCVFGDYYYYDGYDIYAKDFWVESINFTDFDSIALRFDLFNSPQETFWIDTYGFENKKIAISKNRPYMYFQLEYEEFHKLTNHEKRDDLLQLILTGNGELAKTLINSITN